MIFSLKSYQNQKLPDYEKTVKMRETKLSKNTIDSHIIFTPQENLLQTKQTRENFFFFFTDE